MGLRPKNVKAALNKPAGGAPKKLTGMMAVLAGLEEEQKQMNRTVGACSDFVRS